MITIEIDKQGIADMIMAARNARKAVAEFEDRSKPNKQIKKLQIQRWAQNFTSQGGIYGSWAELAPSTIEDRRDQGYGAGPILIRQGTLLAHFVEQNEAGEISNDAVVWNFSNKGSTRGYAGATVSHHTGYRLRGSTIPSRKLWDLNKEDEENTKEILEKWIDTIIARYF